MKTATVIACLRRRYGWSLSSIVAEFHLYSEISDDSEGGFFDLHFINNFKTTARKDNFNITIRKDKDKDKDEDKNKDSVPSLNTNTALLSFR